MGARKKLSAEKRKEAMKTVAIAHLRNVPTSPLVATTTDEVSARLAPSTTGPSVMADQ